MSNFDVRRASRKFYITDSSRKFSGSLLPQFHYSNEKSPDGFVFRGRIMEGPVAMKHINQ